MKHSLYAISVAALLSGCAVTDRTAPSKKTQPIPYTLDAGGVQLVGSAQRIDFGRTDHSTMPAMDKLVGEGAATRSICADGRPYVTWPDGTTLYFSGGAFRGWSQVGPDGSIQTAGATCA